MSASHLTRPARQDMVDRTIDDLYRLLGIGRADIFETETLLQRAYEGLPKYPDDKYFQISVAWPYVSRDVTELLRHFNEPENMWDRHRQLAAICLVLRMQARALERPLFEPIDHSQWIYLGSMRTDGGLVDLWGARDWETVDVRWAQGTLRRTGATTSPDLRIREAYRRLQRAYHGPDI